jgi:hypothetical protein
LTTQLATDIASVRADLTSDVTTINGQITTLQTNVTANTNQILKIGVDVKTLGALANYVDDINRGPTIQPFSKMR